ncbi:MAG: ATP-binding protein [Endomicrobium sp.]|nr:ATP-binding protein [Endomicrobium sp.]
MKRLLSQCEGSYLEFKECTDRISKTVYKTVCAFLNTKGVAILIGVKDNGTVVGVDKKIVFNIKQDFVTSVNNEDKLSPTFCLFVDEFSIRYPT